MARGFGDVEKRNVAWLMLSLPKLNEFLLI
jgi:hypothetical protein